VPTHLKILKFQRNLLIGGLKNKKEIMGINCNGLVENLNKSSLNASPRSSFHDIGTLHGYALVLNYL
jgi:hypothetical protein